MTDMTLEEALEAATVDEELISPVNEVLMINPETRTINVPDSEKLFGARQDMGVERKYFKCPRIVGDNIDLSQHRIFINYVPSKQDGTYNLEDDVQGYWCKDLAVDGDFITFSWEISGNVTRSAGYIAFAVYAKTIDENGNLKTKWHTTIAIGNVLDTLPDGEELATVYPDIVMQLLERMDEVEKNGGNGTSDAVQYIEQTLTEEQQIQARTNIGAASTNEVSKLSEDIVTKASAIKEKASGEVIVVNDSLKAKPLGLAIDGKSEQNQYSGKNLLNARLNVNIKSNDPYYIYNVKPNTTYVLSLSQMLVALGTNATAQHQYRCYDEGNNIVKSGGIAKIEFTSVGEVITKEATLSTTENTSYIQIDLGTYYGSDVSSTIKNLYAQLEEGNVATEIEPYCGGIPSPSPSYPQEIRNIGKYDEASGKYAVEVKCTGKNLLKNTLKNQTMKGVTITVNEDGNITCNGTATGDVYITIAKSLPKVGRCVLSGCPSGGGSSSYELAFKHGETLRDYGEGVEINLSGDTSTDFVQIVIRSGVTVSNLTFKPMIRPVGTDNIYEPYKETKVTLLLDEPLRGIEEYKDCICQRDGVWGVERVIGLLDNAKWIKTNIKDGTNGHRFGNNNLGILRKPNIPIYCTHYRQKRTSSFSMEGDYISTDEAENNNVRIRTLDKDFSTIEEFKAFMLENNVETQYIKAESTFTPFENQDIFKDLSMFYPTTILSNDCNANMEVDYIADTKAYIDKKFAELATAMV